MDSDCSMPTVSDNSVGRLKDLLKKESKRHREKGQCYDTLQKEYDELLQKYAQAENTIDKLRIETLREKIEQCKEQKGNKDFIEQYNKVRWLSFIEPNDLSDRHCCQPVCPLSYQLLVGFF